MANTKHPDGIVVVVSLILCTPLAALGQGFAAGTGEANDPYQIATAEQLISIGADPNLLDKHFVLVNDIDLDPNLPGGRVFSQAVIAPGLDEVVNSFEDPAACDRFTGRFDGRSHTIRRLHIQSAGYYLGLFGKIGEGGRVHNLRIVDATISGSGACRYLGVLAGYIERCTITNCSATGRVSGGGGARSLGGLVGFVWFDGRIIQCSASCDVTGGDGSEGLGGFVGDNGGTVINCCTGGDVSAGIGCTGAGGLVGVNGASIYYRGQSSVSSIGRIIHCWAAGSVTMGEHSDDIGGLVGEDYRSYAIHSFWDVEASRLAVSASGTGLTTGEMQDANTYSDAGWDLVGEGANGTADVWFIPEGGGYPVLAVLSNAFEPRDLAGNGTAEDPYRITSGDDLGAINHYDPSGCYRLEADIDLAGITWSVAPLECFEGALDGGGFVVSNLTVRGGSYLGLFGALRPPAVVRNLGITDANIVGEEDSGAVGGLAGWNDGRIADCRVSGRVAGDDCVGGLVGYNNESGKITNSSTLADVTGGAYACFGGLVGLNNGSVVNSYACIEVNGSWAVGGLAGSNNGNIAACYASGQVVGASDLGGLVGSNSGAVSSSYATVDVWTGNAMPDLGGLVGSNGGKILNCYAVGTVFNAFFGEDVPFGGLIGGLAPFWTKGTVVDSFWDTDVSAVYISQGGMGLTTARMMDPKTYSLNGWADDPNWVLDPGRDYPRLLWEGAPGEPIPAPTIDWFEGSGTQEDPYAVVTAEQLTRIGTASILWDKAFVLASDLDLTGIKVPRIGVCRGTGFSGTFDGVNHTISNLTIGVDGVPASSLGLFGHVSREGWVGRLILANATIETGLGSEGLGILAGVNEGVVTNCAVAGSISMGFHSVGILVGVNEGTIAGCLASGRISGGDYSAYLGGLVGENGAGRIANCYATGSVSGGDTSRSLGGLVGHSRAGSITDCYAAASVSGGDPTYSLGGLVGSTSNSQLRHCYFLMGSEGGGPDNGLGLPLTSPQMQRQTSFVDWDFDAVWMICEGRDYPHLQWEDVQCEE